MHQVKPVTSGLVGSASTLIETFRIQFPSRSSYGIRLAHFSWIESSGLPTVSTHTHGPHHNCEDDALFSRRTWEGSVCDSWAQVHHCENRAYMPGQCGAEDRTSGFVLARQVLYLVSYKPKFVIFIKLNSAVTSCHKRRADPCWALSSMAIFLTLPPQVLSIAVYTSTNENPDAQSS